LDTNFKQIESKLLCDVLNKRRKESKFKSDALKEKANDALNKEKKKV